MIKKKRASGVADEPDWAAEVAAESSEPVVEHEEEASLTVDDRNQIEGFREVAIDDMEQFLNDTIELVHRNEMDRHLEKTDLFASLAAEAGDEAYVAQTVLMVNDCRKGMLTLYVKRFEDLEKSELRWVAYLDPRTSEEVAGDRGDKRSVRTCFFDKWKRHNGEEKLAEGYHATSTSVVAASNLDIALDSSASSKKYWATETSKNGDNAKVHLIHFTLNAASSVNIILFTARTRKSPVGGSTSGGDLTEHDVREGAGRVERQAISDVVTVDKSVVSNLVSLLETSANAGMLGEKQTDMVKTQISAGQKVEIKTVSEKVAKAKLPSLKKADFSKAKQLVDKDPAGARAISALKGTDPTRLSKKQKAEVRSFVEKHPDEGLDFMQMLFGGTAIVFMLAALGIGIGGISSAVSSK
ncbi:hypothetical protein PInf_007767 [Phytophthora infestans]|nr:hypothetical protein PInf_007767 [Phytophthora infestans]